MSQYKGIKTSIDTFTGSTLNSSLWTSNTGADLTVSGGSLNCEDQIAFPGVTPKTFYNLRNNILAFRWLTPTGTTTPTTEFDFDVEDASGANSIGVAMYVGNAATDANQFYANGTVSVSDSGGSNATLGTTTPNGTWIGIGMIGADKVVHVFTSPDGVTWTLHRKITYTGTIDTTALGLYLGTGHTDSGATKSWFSHIDEVALFALHNAKVRVGGAWVDATTKVRVGGAWVLANPKRYVGGSWV